MEMSIIEVWGGWDDPLRPCLRRTAVVLAAHEIDVPETRAEAKRSTPVCTTYRLQVPLKSGDGGDAGDPPATSCESNQLSGRGPPLRRDAGMASR